MEHNEEENEVRLPKNIVTDGDIDFLNYLAESESDKEKTKSFITPSHVLRVYMESSMKECMDNSDVITEEIKNAMLYNVYVTIDGVYSIVGSFDCKKDAKIFANYTSIKLEKTLKRKLQNMLQYGIQTDDNGE